MATALLGVDSQFLGSPRKGFQATSTTTFPDIVSEFTISQS